MFKKILLGFLVAFLLATNSVVYADAVSNYWKLSGTTLYPLKSTWGINVAGGITFGASTMTGALAMGDQNITGANIITGTTDLTLSTASNANLILLPNGTGKTVVGDAMAASLSLTDNDDLLVTGSLEVGESLFTGGVTLATNRGDVPYIDFSVTNAAAAGTAESVPFLIDGKFIMSLYSESDASGGIQNQTVRVVGLQSYGRIQRRQGTDAASATNLVLPTDGDVFELTGTTKVDLISSIGWQDGSVITLICNESVVIDNKTASSGTNIAIQLASSADFNCTENDTLTLVLTTITSTGQAWREVSRTAN